MFQKVNTVNSWPLPKSGCGVCTSGHRQSSLFPFACINGLPLDFSREGERPFSRLEARADIWANTPPPLRASPSSRSAGVQSVDRLRSLGSKVTSDVTNCLFVCFIEFKGFPRQDLRSPDRGDLRNGFVVCDCELDKD